MKIYILPEVHAEIMYYVNKSNVEISGLGRIEKTSTGEMVVTKCYLLKQENAATSTDLDKDAVSTLLYESREDKGDLNFWWHSHVNMGVFWSGTDMGTIKEFGKNGYLLATVFNKKGEHRSAYFQGANGFLPEIFVDAIDTSFAYLPTEAESNKWDAEYKEKAVEKKWTPSTTPATGSTQGFGSGYGHYYNDGRWDDDEYNVYGWGQSADVPAAHKDPAYWKAEDIISESTGMTLKEIVAQIKGWYFKRSANKADELDIEDTLLIFDMYQLIHNRDPNEDEQEAFYQSCIGSWNSCMDVIEKIEEVIDSLQVAVNPIANPSRKGKKKLIAGGVK